jgi:hypothetical protein
MIFVKSFLAGVAALMMAAFLIYGLAVGVPRILELIPYHLAKTVSVGMGSALFQCGR